MYIIFIRLNITPLLLLMLLFYFIFIYFTSEELVNTALTRFILSTWLWLLWANTLTSKIDITSFWILLYPMIFLKFTLYSYLLSLPICFHVFLWRNRLKPMYKFWSGAGATFSLDNGQEGQRILHKQCLPPLTSSSVQTWRRAWFW